MNNIIKAAFITGGAAIIAGLAIASASFFKDTSKSISTEMIQTIESGGKAVNHSGEGDININTTTR